jgi:hypothetical protein
MLNCIGLKPNRPCARMRIDGTPAYPCAATALPQIASVEEGLRAGLVVGNSTTLSAAGSVMVHLRDHKVWTHRSHSNALGHRRWGNRRGHPTTYTWSDDITVLSYVALLVNLRPHVAPLNS